MELVAMAMGGQLDTSRRDHAICVATTINS
jgi:hypothetical protein